MAIQVGYSLLGGSYEQPREATSLVRAGDIITRPEKGCSWGYAGKTG
jgi:hypothetical protein